MSVIRAAMTFRCDIERRPVLGENPYGEETLGDYEVVGAKVPCQWWAEIGQGEVSEVNRDAVIDTSRMLIPIKVDVHESDRINNIRDRRGEPVADGAWEIEGIVPRHRERANFLLLKKVR